MRILGISAYFHDSAACLIEDGQIVAAAQEERFTRRKHDASFPSHAISYCLSEAGIGLKDLDLVGFYENPFLKFSRLIQTYITYAPRGLSSYLTAMPLWLEQKLWMRRNIRRELPGYSGQILFGEHHESHAASAFYPSPFENAAIVTIDGVGERATTTIGVGAGSSITLLKEMRFPHSLGLLYSAFTAFTGFRVNGGEYKMMGLAPYGRPVFVDTIKKNLIDVCEDGSLWLNMDYFTYPSSMAMTGPAFERLFEGPARQPEGPITRREMDLARSIQDITEEVMLKIVNNAHRETGMRDLVMAGGVALNCVGNGRILREGPFNQVWIQPAAGDAGGALGVALSIWHRHLDRPRQSPEALGTWIRPDRSIDVLRTASQTPYADGMKGGLLGPQFSEDEIARFIESNGCVGRLVRRPELAEEVAKLIADQKVVGVFLGRMEFGPRALGARSIVGDARSASMQSVMNRKIKFRESFRPFAPSVLRDHASEWFETDVDSPYMLFVSNLLQSRRHPDALGSDAYEGMDLLRAVRSDVPAITHVDFSARLQTVRNEVNPEYYEIITAFYRLTGCPMIINTSFNVRGEPIVCTPADAYRCFMRTNLDALVLGPYILHKMDQASSGYSGASFEEFGLD